MKKTNKFKIPPLEVKGAQASKQEVLEIRDRVKLFGLKRMAEVMSMSYSSLTHRLNGFSALYRKDYEMMVEVLQIEEGK